MDFIRRRFLLLFVDLDARELGIAVALFRRRSSSFSGSTAAIHQKLRRVSPDRLPRFSVSHSYVVRFPPSISLIVRGTIDARRI